VQNRKRKTSFQEAIDTNGKARKCHNIVLLKLYKYYCWISDPSPIFKSEPEDDGLSMFGDEQGTNIFLSNHNSM
jgi:hypothetical protein